MWKSQSSGGGLGTNARKRGPFGVDPGPGAWVPFKANFRTQPWTERVTDHDADVQTPEPEKGEQTRVPGPNGDKRGTQNPQSAPAAWAAATGGERRLEIGSVGRARPDAGPAEGFRLPPTHRITRPVEIREILRRGSRKKTSHLDVFFLSSKENHSRVGFIVPKHHRSAVERNRIKRRLREASRREILPRLRIEGVLLDLLIRARREAYKASYQQLRNELLEVTEELCSGRHSWR
jgi:ribonuclease P protein component